MSEQDTSSPVFAKTAIVTGSSRGVGAALATLLASEGFNVVVNYRQKAPRAEKVVAKIVEQGGHAVAVGADITDERGADALVEAALENFGSLDVLVLNASGGMESGLGEDYALRLNRDAQVNLAQKAAAKMKPGSRIVFVTSHQAHFIKSVETMDEYQAVALSKRAGEDALEALIPEFAEAGISFVVVSGDMIEGTVTALLLDRANPGAIQSRRDAAGKLYTVEEFAEQVAKMVSADVPTGHIELVGGARDFLGDSADEASEVSTRR